jgi:hypothetical protein
MLYVDLFRYRVLLAFHCNNLPSKPLTLDHNFERCRSGLESPIFHNISWKAFIIFGVLCLGAAAQAFLSYPETARKSLEEIEQLFKHGGPKPWNTRVARSGLEAHIQAVIDTGGKGVYSMMNMAQVLMTLRT